MTASIPTKEPTVVTAGDTWKWAKSLPDYLPADGWALSYVLVKDGNQETLSSSNNGDGTHLVNADAASTASIEAGEYRWQSYVTKSGERYTVGRGEITVKPNFAAQDAGHDGRSNARKWLDSLEAALASMTTGEIKQASISYNNRSATYRSVEDLLKAISRAKQMVESEESAERLAAGLGSGNRILVRF